MVIANDLTERRIEYMPNEFSWNKSRVLRVVKDARYNGENKFPPIIDKPTFNTVQALYNEKRMVTENFLDKDVHRILIPVKCPECGGVMKRRCDCRRKNHEKWYCQNKDCKKVITIKDDAFIYTNEKKIKKIMESIPEKDIIRTITKEYESEYYGKITYIQIVLKSAPKISQRKRGLLDFTNRRLVRLSDDLPTPFDE